MKQMNSLVRIPEMEAPSGAVLWPANARRGDQFYTKLLNNKLMNNWLGGWALARRQSICQNDDFLMPNSWCECSSVLHYVYVDCLTCSVWTGQRVLWQLWRLRLLVRGSRALKGLDCAHWPPSTHSTCDCSQMIHDYPRWLEDWKVDPPKILLNFQLQLFGRQTQIQRCFQHLLEFH